MEYTFKFKQDSQRKFREVLSRLDETEYTVIKDVHYVDETNKRYSEMQAVIEMEPEACLTFRLGMKELSIRKKRTEEELAQEKELNDRNKIKVTIYTGTAGSPTS
jgi:adenylate kinase